MTTSWVYHPNSNRCTSSRMPSPQYSHALCCKAATELLYYSCVFYLVEHAGFSSCCAFCGLTIYTISFSSTLLNFLSSFTFLYSGHSLHLCPFSPHLKHSTTTVSCLLIVLSPLSCSCSYRPGAQTSYSTNTIFPFFSLILPSVR